MLAPFRSKRFEVVARLGAGGMGVVYEAIDHEGGARVALKTIRDPQAGSLLRFKNEFRALHDLRHPNLVSLGELHEEDGAWFFTMELIDGVDFLRWVRSGRARGFVDSGTITPDRKIRLQTPISRVTDSEVVARAIVDRIASSPTVIAPSNDAISAVGSRVVPSDASSGDDAVAARGQTLIGPPAETVRADSGGHPRVPFDEARLRSGLRQLAQGLQALHQAKRIHRDIKPSNLIVSREGRVVLLDFGLVSEMRGSGSTNVEVVGTAEYMAPEQASAKHIGGEADWYAVGVLLFEVMVGRFPFEGTAIQVLSEKQRAEAPRASSFVPDLPADLDRLCADLLARDPAARPTAEEILARLADVDVASSHAPNAEPTLSDDPFVGREREREALHDAATPALDPELAQPVTVTLEGESGVGKSALLARFLEELSRRVPDAVLLRGRCYERESVTFKAFDGIVDALATHLRALRPVEAAGLVPRYAALLLEAFPVLGVVPALAQAPIPRAAIASPAERRNRLFDAMRELFQRLRAISPVVLAIDDVQWADRDSLLLLQEILRQPDGPPLLVVGTSRPLASAGSAAIDPATPSRAGLASLGVKTHLLRIGRLPADEARALAETLLAARSSSRPPTMLSLKISLDLDAIVRESGGHPLFIDALVRHACAEGATTGPAIRLDDALWQRVTSLEPAVRRLVEVVGLMGSPVPIDLVRVAAEVPGDKIGDVVRQAKALNLVKTTGPRLTDRIAPYHDRVRESVTARLSADDRRTLHATIARAIAAEAPQEIELLAEHSLGAGAIAAAVEHFRAAAKKAFDALAIDRAADLYARAIELGIDDATARRETTIALGDALATAGRGAEAAATYERARAWVTDENVEFELRRRVAEQLLQSGYLREGRQAIASVLQRLGIPYARSPIVALLKALVRKLYVRLRGYRFEVRERSEVAARDLVRLDVLWTAVRGLMFIDFLRGFDFQSRYMLEALRVGDRRHLANGFAAEASSGAASGAKGLSRAPMLFAKLDQVSAPIDDPAVLAHNHSHRSFKHYMAGEFIAARREGELGMAMYADLCLGVNWYLSAMRRYLAYTYYYLGDFLELQRRLKPWRGDAHRRSDLFAMANLSLGVANVSFLIDDDVEGARHDVARTMERWKIEGFTTQHLQAIVAEVQCDLYCGDAPCAWRRVHASWRAIERSLLLKARNLNLEARHLRARAAVAAALPARDATLLAIAEREVRQLRRDGLDWSRGFAELVAAAIAHQRGDKLQAETSLHAAIDAFSRVEMLLYASAARARLGAIVGGAAGDAMVVDAARAFRAQGVARPERMIATMAPGFG